MTTTFTYAADYGAEGDFTPDNNKAQFGDGYAQVVGKGINNLRRVYTLTFTQKPADIDAIMDFLKARNGADKFFWTPYRETQGLWLCPSWKRGITSYGLETVTATFEEQFGA